MIGGTKPMKMAVKSAMKMKAEKAMKLKEEAAMKLREKAAMKAAKPDYIDIDKDGNETESMKKAAADKKSGDSPDKMKKDSSMKLKSAMKDDRSLIQKAKDEAKQVKSFIKGAGDILADKDYFRPGLAIKEGKEAYAKTEKEQESKRTGSSSPKPMKKDAAMKVGHSPKKEKLSYAEAKEKNPNLDKLIKTRSGAAKGSPEYTKAQNAINKAYGVGKRHVSTRGSKIEAPKTGDKLLSGGDAKKPVSTAPKPKTGKAKVLSSTKTKVKPNKTKTVSVSKGDDGKLTATMTKVKKSGKTKTKTLSKRRAARIARREGIVD